MEVRGSWRTLLGDGTGSYFGLLNMVTWLALNAELWWMGAIVNIKVIHWPSKTDPLALV